MSVATVAEKAVETVVEAAEKVVETVEAVAVEAVEAPIKVAEAAVEKVEAAAASWLLMMRGGCGSLPVETPTTEAKKAVEVGKVLSRPDGAKFLEAFGDRGGVWFAKGFLLSKRWRSTSSNCRRRTRS